MAREHIFTPFRTRWIFGINYAEKVGAEVKRLASGKALIVTDEGVEKAGLVDKVKKSMEDEGCNVEIFNAVQPEPSIESMEPVVDLVRKHGFRIIVGVGGGSSLDTAKVASLMATNSGSVNQYIGSFLVKRPGIPMILIPTTAGTGSEVSSCIVLSVNHVKKTIYSHFVFPDVAIVDPVMTTTMPPKLTAGTAFDALSHAIGSVMSLYANPMSDALGLMAVRLISGSLRTAYCNPEHLKARSNVAFAASIACLASAHSLTRVTIEHDVCYTLSRYNVPHHIGCAVALPYVMKFNLPACPEKLVLVASAMGEDTKGLPKYEAASKAVQLVLRLMNDVELPTSLKEINIPQADLQDLAHEMVTTYHRPNNPRKVTPENALKLYQRIWRGEKC